MKCQSLTIVSISNVLIVNRMTSFLVYRLLILLEWPQGCCFCCISCLIREMRAKHTCSTWGDYHWCYTLGERITCRERWLHVVHEQHMQFDQNSRYVMETSVRFDWDLSWIRHAFRLGHHSPNSAVRGDVSVSMCLLPFCKPCTYCWWSLKLIIPCDCAQYTLPTLSPAPLLPILYLPAFLFSSSTKVTRVSKPVNMVIIGRRLAFLL